MLVDPIELKKLSTKEYDRLLKRCMMKIDTIMDDVANIVSDVRDSGDSAVLKYTKIFDNVELSANQIAVTQEEIKEAYFHKLGSGDSDTINSLGQLYKNLIESHEVQQRQCAQIAVDINRDIGHWQVGRVPRPIDKVGIYAPNGTTSYPTTVIMAAAPAKVAGVEEITVTSKPNINGFIDDWILIACDIAGVDKIFKVGGAQAIGSLAFGTETIPKVSKIVGPGNIYVTAAKMYVSYKGYCSIDFPAGPSEILIIADETADPTCITWDMFSQAEHDENACAILVTTSKKLAREVAIIIEKELSECQDRRDIKEKSLKNYGSIIITDTLSEALAFSNDFAPEHLALMLSNNYEAFKEVKNAGTVCIGDTSPVAASDYFSGTNHILPTGGWAKTCSGLSVDSFQKRITYQDIPRNTLMGMQPHIANLSKAEKLYDAHGKSIEKRFRKNK